MVENFVPDSAGLIQSVTLVLEELASTDAAVGAAEGMSPCRGTECGSAFDATGSDALTLLVLCIILAVAATLVIRAGRKRSNVDVASAEDG